MLALLKKYSSESACLVPPCLCSGCFETLKIFESLSSLVPSSNVFLASKISFSVFPLFFNFKINSLIKIFCFYSFAYKNIVKYIILWFIKIANLLIRIICQSSISIWTICFQYYSLLLNNAFLHYLPNQ